VLSSWSWLLPPKFTLWMVNRFGDLFLVPPDGVVYMLDVGGGTLTKLAESRDEFGNRIDEDDNANQWLMIPLVDRMVAAGITLKAGQCYGLGNRRSWAAITLLTTPARLPVGIT
jgi:hypothetical protein